MRCSRLGVFNKIFASLASTSDSDDVLMIDATHLKAHLTAVSLLKKGLFPDISGEPKAAWTPSRMPCAMVMGGPCSYTFPKDRWAIMSVQSSHIQHFRIMAPVWFGDKGYDSDEYCAALKAKGILPCIPPRKGRLLPANFDKNL